MLDQIIVCASRKKEMRCFVTISKALERYWIQKGVDPSKILTAHDGFSEYFFQNELSQPEASILNPPSDLRIK